MREGQDPGAGPGEGQPARGTPESRPAPAAGGQRLKINWGRRVPGLEKGRRKEGEEKGRGRGRRPASLPHPEAFDLAQVRGPGPSLEPSERRSVGGSVAQSDSSPARSRDPESLVTHLGGKGTSGLCAPEPR